MHCGVFKSSLVHVVSSCISYACQPVQLIIILYPYYIFKENCFRSILENKFCLFSLHFNCSNPIVISPDNILLFLLLFLCLSPLIHRGIPSA